MSPKQIALVTGANRGIGLEISSELAKRGIYVIMGSRDKSKGEAAVQKIKKHHDNVEWISLDVSDPASIEQACAAVISKFGGVDILVNNAGILIDGNDNGFGTPVETLEKTFRTNTVGPFLLCQKLIPSMVKRGGGRVINISSGLGQLSESSGGYPSYRLSKTALNAVTRLFSVEANHPKIFVNSMCPGWVRTDMGGANAARSIEKGAETAVWLATEPGLTMTGQFFRDKEIIDW